MPPSIGTMLKAHLIRISTHPHAMRGLLILGSNIFATLEPPWKDNARNLSAIPKGTYEATFLNRSASGRYRNVWHLQNVPERSGILIHQGNTPQDTRGCILIGTRFGKMNAMPAVLNSRSALTAFNQITTKSPFTLHIHEV